MAGAIQYRGIKDPRSKGLDPGIQGPRSKVQGTDVIRVTLPQLVFSVLLVVYKLRKWSQNGAEKKEKRATLGQFVSSDIQSCW